jgi:predicted RNA-binding Zn-ribbon protein involved in translation (DUF1610 family)
MATWILTCKNCGAEITCSQIGDTLLDYLIPARPNIPPEGVEYECPTCRTTSIYRRYERVFRSQTERL